MMMGIAKIAAEGFIFGLSIAAPIGPISLLCMQRTLKQGFLLGIISGIGTAAADAVYAAVSSFSLGIFSSFLLDHSFWVRLLGGGFLSYLGIKGLRQIGVNTTRAIQTKQVSFLWAFSSNFLLTLSNPMTILTFLAVSAALGAVSISSSTLLIAGVFLGSASWWVMLVGFIHFLRGSLLVKHMKTLDYASSLIILAFGLYNIVTIMASKL